MTLAGQQHAGIEILHVLYRESLAQCNGHCHLTRSAVHGVYIGYIDHGTFVAKMFKRYVREVKMNTFHKHVRCYKHLLVLAGVVQHGAVIAYAVKRGAVLGLEFLCEVVYKTEFTVFRYLSTFGLWHIAVFYMILCG